METYEVKSLFLSKRQAKAIKKKIMNAGFITQVKEVSLDKIGEVDLFRVVIYHKDLKPIIEKIVKDDINWISK